MWAVLLKAASSSAGEKGLFNQSQVHHVSTATERGGGGVSRNRAVPSFTKVNANLNSLTFKPIHLRAL